MNRILAIIILVLCAFVVWAGREAEPAPVFKIVPQKVPMSVRELQTFLNEQGHVRYKCKVDGRMGKETQTAWDNYICDRYAIEEFKNYD